MRRTLLLAGLAALATGAAGCGVGAGSGSADVRLTISDRFGTRLVSEERSVGVPGGETVMRLLRRYAEVRTRYGGGFVQAIGGLAGGRSGGRPVDWFYYVNGVEAPEGAAARRVRAGDRIWWDRHAWDGAMRVPAVVGSFPEPFVHGIDRKRLPARIDCAPRAERACDEVAARLRAEGVPVARSLLGAAVARKTVRVLVGRWPAVRADTATRRIEQGPRASGVYARMARSGATLALLDSAGRVTRTLGPGAGLLAATREGEQAPVWVVTGTDAAGVLAAARALRERTLARRFAVAVSGDRVLPLPEARR